ncbi:serine/threonine-protein phosphatase 4 regulatory subunit 2-like [Prorops nasuta]|uniref:serine/threonine-protein phosphatase 4 regulatory subunit 2-like n=1 Tax=Prorops nasuta TaxID=863751 RepID=UPI0034CFAAAC
MENPEEVLQALDEFQKMRPTEIPLELEEYLCWVAKTGDPVYQWSLIKALFREKLTRVMTDFYESCPSLELASCPNVEQFNYDTMKSNLLDRLESFANAPFTVQRICELLTAPRKEYNRVDKFMRAIEKNILVVSTREPGPTARRSENGDGLVNGSLEDDTTLVQTSHEVEMDSWVKDCTTAVPINVQHKQSEPPLPDTVIPNSTIVKNICDQEENDIHQKSIQSMPTSDIETSNFMTSTPEFPTVANITSQVQQQDSTIVSGIQSLSDIAQDESGISGDVPEAIMNEDTSSQPSLDLENEDNDTIEAAKKLQTTFQATDFSNDSKISKFYLDAEELNEKIQTNTKVLLEERDSVLTENSKLSINSSLEQKSILGTSESNELTTNENILQAVNGKIEEKVPKLENKVDSTQLIIEDNSINESSTVPLALVNSDMENLCSSKNSDDIKTHINLYNSEENIVSNEESDSLYKEDNKSTDSEAIDSPNVTNVCSENLNILEKCIQIDKDSINVSSEVSKPLIEEPVSDSNSEGDFKKSNYIEDDLTIEETSEEDSKVSKCCMQDPIIEEPKEIEFSDKDLEGTSEPVDISKVLEDSVLSTKTVLIDDEKVISVENHDALDSEEHMDIDSEESLSMFHQDEPMEQEADLTTS